MSSNIQKTNIYVVFVVSNLSGCKMAVNVLKKTNGGLMFLYRKLLDFFLPLKILLCSALIQPYFDYECQGF